MNTYKHIFFDLDRTLWDFDSNSFDALNDIVVKYDLKSNNISLEDFINKYRSNNDALWSLYREKKIVKRILRWKRFYITLLEFGVDNVEMAQKIGEDYLKISATKRKLFPYSVEILSYLHKIYKLHIITNGFEEVQHLKLSNCEIDKYFDVVITSERASAHKPKPEIFEFALKETQALISESIMIGDDFNIDIVGAQNIGMDQIYFNPKSIINNNDSPPTFEINSLIEIEDIL